MARAKPRQSVELRNAVADVLRAGLSVAERFEGLGHKNAGAGHRARLRALDKGDAVTVAAHELAAALDEVGRVAETRDVLGDRITSHYVIGADDTYAAAG